MSPELAASCLAPIPMAVVVWRLGTRSGLLLGLSLSLTVLALGLLVASSPLAGGRHQLLADLAPGTLALTRLASGLAIGSLAAQLLEAALGRRAGAEAAAALLLAGPALLVLTSTAMVPLAAGTGLALGVVWVRWVRAAGPQLAVRSLGRQAGIAAGALLAAAALLPSVKTGSAPAVMVAILLAGAVTSLIGVVPFSIVPHAAERIGSGAAAVWRVWLLPVGAYLGLRLVAGSPHSVALPLQELLIGLGVAAAVFWGLHSLVAGPRTRYWSTLAADGGLVAVGVGLGSPTALAGVLVLILAHWLAGAVLGEDTGRRSQLLAWVGISGTPPFGGFTGRLLVVLGAAAVSWPLMGLVLFAGGLQLAGAARGMRTAAAASPRLGSAREVMALAAATATLALGVVPQAALAAIFGLHP